MSRDNGATCSHLTLSVEHDGKTHTVKTSEAEIDAVELTDAEIKRAALRALKIERAAGEDITRDRTRIAER